MSFQKTLRTFNSFSSVFFIFLTFFYSSEVFARDCTTTVSLCVEIDHESDCCYPTFTTSVKTNTLYCSWSDQNGCVPVDPPDS